MTDPELPKKLIVMGIVLPLAILLGFLVATPDDLVAIGVVMAVVSILAFPFVLKWHHLMLVLSLNAALVLAFLPGVPTMWMLMAFVSSTLTLLGGILDKKRRLIYVPSVAWPLVAFGAVVFVTAKLTGGAGLRVLGGGVYGGKKYFYVWLAILVYFAVSWVRIPLKSATAYVSGYVLSGLTSIFSNLVYMAGPTAWILYQFIPVDLAMHQIIEDYTGGPGSDRFSRLGGVAVAAYAVVPYFMIRFGAGGVLNLHRPWRLALLLAVVMIGALGGFRSTVIFAGLLLAIQFLAEGLHRTRLFPVLVVFGVLMMAALVPIASKLPLSVQRSLSFLPIPVSQVARFDAEQSSLWRVQMWSMVTAEIPVYFWRGKGFTASSTDYYLTQEMVRRGLRSDQEMMILAGDFHNGPLSILIPFGIWGVSTFLWFIFAGIRLLYRNFRYGDPRLKKVNTFLLSYFIAKVIFFLAVFGAIHLDILAFVGIVALSVSVNGGLRRLADLQALATASAGDAPASEGAALPRSKFS